MEKEFWALAPELQISWSGGSDVGSGERELDNRETVSFFEIML